MARVTNINIPMKNIKAVMKDWYNAYFERDDDSYRELYSALRTLHAAGLISHDEFKKISEYDHELFRIICEKG